MFEDNSIDLVYACHLLEHFHRDKTTGVLTEWKRVLRSGGVLRLAVPDFESVAKVYQKNGDVNSILGLVVGRQDYIYNIHYMIFDFISLSTILQEVGFSSVKRYDWRDTIHKDFDDYSQAYIPHMDKENGVLMSLNVEAVK
jgi:predicted SAM-dependent methyltransferase